MSNNHVQQTLPVAIIGGGPVGLAAAAQLAKRNESFILFEAGKDVAANVESWKHVRLFSPWRYNMDDSARELLEMTGWQVPSLEHLPTGEELISEYMRPLANLSNIKQFIHFDARVVSIGRKGLDKMVTHGRDELPFVVQARIAGTMQSFEARAVIDASGTWDNPNPIGSGGIAAQGEREAREHIFYGIPDVLGAHRARYAGKKVMVVGSGHSSINALLELLELEEEEPNTKIVWVLRKKQLERVYGGEANDALPARGALGTRIRTMVEANRLEVFTPFQIFALNSVAGKFDVHGTLDGNESIIAGVDEIVSNTGSRPDMSYLREVRVAFDPTLESVPELAPLIDPNFHSCGSVPPHGERELRQPEKNFYIAGLKSYGRAPTFLMATGYEQVRSIVAALAGDWEAATKVALNLPETGVCSSDFDIPGQSCCGPTETATPVITLDAIGGVAGYGTPKVAPATIDIAMIGADAPCCDTTTKAETACCASAEPVLAVEGIAVISADGTSCCDTETKALTSCC